jgi:hypothetical protein
LRPVVDFDLIAFSAFAVILAGCGIYAPQVILKYLRFFISAVLGVLALFLIEHSTMWLAELRQTSRTVGSFPLFCLFYGLLLALLVALDTSRAASRGTQHLAHVRPPRSILRAFLGAASWAILIVTAIMVLRLLPHPALSLGVDRFAYRNLFINGIWLLLQKYWAYSVPLQLMAWTLGHRRKVALTWLLWFAYLFLSGEKYGGFMGLFTLILAFFVSTNSASTAVQIRRIAHRYGRRLILVLLVTAVFSLALTLISYARLSTDNPFSALTARVAQQGQLWWNTYSLRRAVPAQPTAFLDELNPLPGNCGEDGAYDCAVYRVMYLAAPANLVDSKIRAGSSYTESSAASVYYYFGPLGLVVFSTLCAWLLYFFTNWFVRATRAFRVIESVLVVRILLLIPAFAFSSFFTFLLTPDVLLTFPVLAFLRLWDRSRQRGQPESALIPHDLAPAERVDPWAS